MDNYGNAKVECQTYAGAFSPSLSFQSCNSVCSKMEGDTDWVTIGRKQKSESSKVVVQEIEVNRKHYRVFFRRHAELIQKISNQHGGVHISFPRSGSKSSKVVLKGPKNFVNSAKFAIMEVVRDLESQVVVECIIPNKDHGQIIGSKGTNIQSLSEEYGVVFRFPPRAPDSAEGIETSTGSGRMSEEYGVVLRFPPRAPDSAEVIETSTGSGRNDETSATKETANSRDLISIKGKKENCLRAKEALINLVPSDLAVPVPFRFHGLIIGPRGRTIGPMCVKYGVGITVAPYEQRKECVYIQGPLYINVRMLRRLSLSTLKTSKMKKTESTRIALKRYHLLPSVYPKMKLL